MCLSTPAIAPIAGECGGVTSGFRPLPACFQFEIPLTNACATTIEAAVTTPTRRLSLTGMGRDSAIAPSSTAGATQANASPAVTAGRDCNQKAKTANGNAPTTKAIEPAHVLAAFHGRRGPPAKIPTRVAGPSP